MIIYAFLKKENINYSNSTMLTDYIATLDIDLKEKTIRLFDKLEMPLSLDCLVEMFEQIIPSDIKKKKGIAYRSIMWMWCISCYCSSIHSSKVWFIIFRDYI